MDVIQNRKWIIIQAVVAITFGVLFFSLLQKPVYVATSKVMITDKAAVNLFGEILFPWSSYRSSIDTQMELIKSPLVAEKVIRQLRLSSVTSETLIGQVAVEQVGETNLVQIHAQDNDPEKAKDIADAFAQSYLLWSQEFSQHQSRVLRKELVGKIQETRDDILIIGKKISEQNKGESVSEDVKLQLGLASNLYTMLAEKNEQLKINEQLQSGNVKIVAPATTPAAPISPTSTKNGILGMLAGTIFGLGLAFLVEYLDNTLKTHDDIEKYFGLPLLGQIPNEEPVKTGRSKKRKTTPYGYGRSNAAEAYRALRTNIQYLNFDKSMRSMIVTSGGPQEGKTTVLTNLAVTLAQAGSKVIVICCDLRRPSVHKKFSLSNSEGLSSVLAGNIAFEDVLQQPVGIEGLKVITSGPLPPNPSELLGSRSMQGIIEKAGQMADFVLIDTPPALAVTDCAVIAPKVDGVMIIVSAGRTTRDVAKQVKARLENVAARLLGVVLNNVMPGKGYGYYYYYSYSESEGPPKGKRRIKRLAPTFIGSLGVIAVLGLSLYLADTYFLRLGIFPAIVDFVSPVGRLLRLSDIRELVRNSYKIKI